MSRGPILPGATVGVVGGGQLGRMLAIEARHMGYRVLVLDPNADSPAAQVADDHLTAPLDDIDAIRELGHRSDVVTLEWENADVAALRELEGTVPVRPGPHLLEVAQHRVREKDAARRLGLSTAEYRPVTTISELEAAIAELGTPAVLKTAQGGYDGKGQVVLRSPEEAQDAFSSLYTPGADLILEEWVRYRMEASVVCARGPGGETATFPVGENIHRNGILDTTLVPARLEEPLLREARAIGEALAEGLGVVGLFAVELFVTEDDRLLVNEIAPRPHNSGHYTWEACPVSQFEQQLRAICGLPLGSTELLRPSAMINLLGEEIGTGESLPGTAQALSQPTVALHLYGKRQGRTGRKMGHLTALGSSTDEALRRVRAAKDALTSSTAPGSDILPD